MSDSSSGGGGKRRSDPVADKAREEFFSEAQELIDGLSRDLLALDTALREGVVLRPEVINDVFRGVHTLKGLAGLFGATRMSGLSHELENVLDDVRLGRLTLTAGILDLLFKAIELYTQILASDRTGDTVPEGDVEVLLIALSHLSSTNGDRTAGVIAQYDLDPSLLSVLTEYEEHRLRTCIQTGFGLYRIRVRFALATIDTSLEELKTKVRPFGEILTYLPTGTATDIDVIELEILMASQTLIAPLSVALAAPGVTIEEIRRRGTPLPPRPRESLDEEQGDDDDDDAAPRAAAPASVSVFAPPPSSSVGKTSAKSGENDLSLRSISRTVRVDIRKLDYLMTIVGELAIVRTALARLGDKVRGRGSMRELGAEIHRIHRGFDRYLSQMQSGILEVRMVPLGQVFDKLARVVRQISRDREKDVSLVITGAETEIDKLIVEELSDPLMHMIRNAIDHGVERSSDRVKLGKPSVGTIALNAFQKGNHVLIEVEDDGAGMNLDVLLAAAVKKGIVSPSDAKDMTPSEILGLVFVAGFTTRQVATDLSGRGVGLDVVKTNIAKLGGVVDITSEVGIGTKMTITLPVTLAIISVLIVETAGRSYALSLATIEEAIVFDERLVRRLEGREVMTVRGASLPICRLAEVFGLRARSAASVSTERSFVVIASVGNRRLGFVVDRLEGQQDIVIKALGNSLESVRGFVGAAELGDQRIALVLDVPALIEETLVSETSRFAGSLEGRA